MREMLLPRFEFGVPHRLLHVRLVFLFWDTLIKIKELRKTSKD